MSIPTVQTPPFWWILPGALLSAQYQQSQSALPHAAPHSLDDELYQNHRRSRRLVSSQTWCCCVVRGEPKCRGSGGGSSAEREQELMWAERKLHAQSLNVCTNLLMASRWCRRWIYCLYISEAERFMSLWASPGSTPGGRLRSCWGVWKEVKLRLSVISTTADRKKHTKLILFVYNHVLVDMW